MCTQGGGYVPRVGDCVPRVGGCTLGGGLYRITVYTWLGTVGVRGVVGVQAVEDLCVI